MFEIITEQLAKKFNREWIFRNLSISLKQGDRLAIVGPNGSGKSTLLQVLSGVMPHSEGKTEYWFKNQKIEVDDWYKYLIIAAPYLELIEEFSSKEFLDFHQKFKSLKPKHNTKQIIDWIELPAHKPIKYFSSGMKQRLKLAVAFCSDTPLLLLDEPTSNLDTHWTAWYQNEVSQLSDSQIVVICSNVEKEYEICKKILDIAAYK